MMKTLFNADEQEAAGEASRVFARVAHGVLQHKEYAVIALPGGRSVLHFFKALQRRDDIIWKRLHFFMLDERLVDLESDDSNFRQAYEHFFIDLVEAKKISWSNLHPFIYKPQDTDRGVGGYVKEFEEFGGEYDIVVAGVGEDGHVGALFPGHSALDSLRTGRNFAQQNERAQLAEQLPFLTVTDAPKPPAGRMSASVNLIRQARAAFVFFIGDNKRTAYDQFLNDEVNWRECPAKVFREVDELYVVTNLTSTKS